MKFLRSFVFYVTIFIWGCTLYLLFSPDPFFWMDKHPSVPSRGAHLILFFALAFSTYCAQRRPRFFLTFFLLVAFGLASELIQYFVPHRSFEWLDLLEDVIGSALGVCLGFLAMIVVRKILACYRSFFSRREPSQAAPDIES